MGGRLIDTTARLITTVEHAPEPQGTLAGLVAYALLDVIELWLVLN